MDLWPQENRQDFGCRLGFVYHKWGKVGGPKAKGLVVSLMGVQLGVIGVQRGCSYFC